MALGVELVDQNPWWKNKEAIKQDRNLVALAKSIAPLLRLWLPFAL